MDAALSVILPPFGFPCKAKPLLLQIGGSSPQKATKNPVYVTLTIGGDSGATSVTAKIFH
jgi:hypothetical protein